MDFLKQEFYNNTIIDYLASLLIIIGGFIILAVIKAYVINRIKRKGEQSALDKILLKSLGRTFLAAFSIGVIYLSIQHLELNESFSNVIRIVGVVVITILIIRFIISIIHYALLRYWVEKSEEGDKASSLKAVMPVIKIVVYGIGLFFMLDNLGFKVSTLLAGLGIGGVAVALAGQAVLGDLFSYFAILFDKPFQIGDFIIVDNFMGVIEKTGIKTTRIKSLSGEQLVFSNQDLTNSRVRNYKKMQERRIAFKIGVIYQTALEHLKEAPEIIKNIIENIEETRFDRAHFFEYGDFSLNFEIVYYIFGADYNKYMDIQQKINLALYEEFSKRGIEFAYPTQTLFLNKENA